MTTRKKLKELGLSHQKIAGFFDLTPSSFQNSSARKRYELAIFRCVEHMQERWQNKNDADPQEPDQGTE